MEFTLENEILTVTVTTSGAQVKSVLRKCDGVEHIWQADPAVWGQHAPILFPYAGRLPEGKMTAKGRLFEGLAAHGFARDMEHALVSQRLWPSGPTDSGSCPPSVWRATPSTTPSP